MTEIYNSYPKTFTVPEGAVKFKVVVHDKAITDLPVIDPQLEKGNRVSPFRPSFKDIPPAVTYMAEALKNDTSINGGLVATTLIKVGAKQVSGLWEEKAGINGAGTNPATPTFWGGGSLDEAVNTVANGVGTQAPFVVTRDGRVFAYAGYIGGFQLIDKVLSTDSLEMGLIDGLPRIKVRDLSQGGREAVVIGDIPMTPMSALSGSGNIDVVPILVTKITEAASGVFYITQNGISDTKISLSSTVSANMSYNMSMIISDIFIAGSVITLGSFGDHAQIYATIKISIIDDIGNTLGSYTYLYDASSDNGFDIFGGDKSINVQFATKGNTVIYCKYEFTQIGIRENVDRSRNSKLTTGIKESTHIIIATGKGSIEIGRGFQAIFGQQKYFKIEDKVGVPFMQSEGVHEHNGCVTQDLLIGIYATGTTIVKWRAHRTYAAKTDFTLSKVSAGIYKLIHNLQTKGVIANVTDYRLSVTCGGIASSIVTASVTGNEFNFTTGADTDMIFIQIWSLKGWGI